jgi:hypothetical protein
MCGDVMLSAGNYGGRQGKEQVEGGVGRRGSAMCRSGQWEDSKHIHSDAEPISDAGIEEEFDSRWGRLMRHVVWFLSHLKFRDYPDR